MFRVSRAGGKKQPYPTGKLWPISSSVAMRSREERWKRKKYSGVHRYWQRKASLTLVQKAYENQKEKQIALWNRMRYSGVTNLWINTLSNVVPGGLFTIKSDSKFTRPELHCPLDKAFPRCYVTPKAGTHEVSVCPFFDSDHVKEVAYGQ